MGILSEVHNGSVQVLYSENPSVSEKTLPGSKGQTKTRSVEEVSGDEIIVLERGESGQDLQSKTLPQRTIAQSCCERVLLNSKNSRRVHETMCGAICVFLIASALIGSGAVFGGSHIEKNATDLSESMVSPVLNSASPLDVTSETVATVEGKSEPSDTQPLIWAGLLFMAFSIFACAAAVRYCAGPGVIREQKEEDQSSQISPRQLPEATLASVCEASTSHPASSNSAANKPISLNLSDELIDTAESSHAQFASFNAVEDLSTPEQKAAVYKNTRLEMSVIGYRAQRALCDVADDRFKTTSFSEDINDVSSTFAPQTFPENEAQKTHPPVVRAKTKSLPFTSASEKGEMIANDSSDDEDILSTKQFTIASIHRDSHPGGASINPGERRLGEPGEPGKREETSRFYDFIQDTSFQSLDLNQSRKFKRHFSKMSKADFKKIEQAIKDKNFDGVEQFLAEWVTNKIPGVNHERRKQIVESLAADLNKFPLAPQGGHNTHNFAWNTEPIGLVKVMNPDDSQRS